MTLVELLVVLVVLGVIAGIAVGAVASLRAPSAGERVHSSARAFAIRTGQPLATWDSTGRLLLYLPDGRALDPGVDPLTGVINARR